MDEQHIACSQPAKPKRLLRWLLLGIGSLSLGMAGLGLVLPGLPVRRLCCWRLPVMCVVPNGSTVGWRAIRPLGQ